MTQGGLRNSFASGATADRALLRDMAREFGRYSPERLRGQVIHRLTFWVEGDRHRITSEPTAHGHRRSFRSREHALEVLEEIRAEVRRGRTPMQALAPYLRSSPEVLLSTWIDRWVRMMRVAALAGDRSPTYLRELVRFSKGPFGFWSQSTIWEVNTAKLRKWNVEMTEAGYAPKMRKNILGAFRSCLSWLVEQGELEAVPIFPTIPVDPHVPTILTPAEQALILEQIPVEKRGIFLAMARLGLRAGEARALNVEDLQDGWITVSHAMKGGSSKAPRRGTKTRRVRRLPAFRLGPDLLEWIDRYVPLRDRMQRTVPLFRHPDTGQRWYQSLMAATWSKARNAAGLPHAKLQESTRHTLATLLLEREVPLEVIQTLLGHTSSRTTLKHYAQITDETVVKLLGG